MAGVLPSAFGRMAAFSASTLDLMGIILDLDCDTLGATFGYSGFLKCNQGGFYRDRTFLGVHFGPLGHYFGPRLERFVNWGTTLHENCIQLH